ncbi:phosphoribosyltransferase [Spiroplasma culicicola]|uniref:Hypoxanthine-guanine phosphoribosyltransferase n=1 Tax=Spiroplasma culicicola AES-1 TaxID=1276246 RepID=W6A922_9MOLU|nr:phosphoribosyltransferase family protein [Spiroplasma culicicola]AHI53390.1 hypoxanthine-guanine phosphoribosyltransferase [Spiroplasma culicicola AES-1]
MIDNHKLVTLITEEEIKAAVIKAANDYAKLYENQQLTIVAELSSTFVFVADLIRELPIDVTIQFITRKPGEDHTAKIDLGLTDSLEDKNVLIVCDIFYKGNALKKTYDLVMAENPKDVKLLSLIDKKSKEKNEELNVESLFKLDDVFIVGYGLTHNESYRGLKGIYNLQVEEK